MRFDFMNSNFDWSANACDFITFSICAVHREGKRDGKGWAGEDVAKRRYLSESRLTSNCCPSFGFR